MMSSRIAIRGFLRPLGLSLAEATQMADSGKVNFLTMVHRDYEAILQCTSALQGMLNVELFLGAAISVGLITLSEAKGILETVETGQLKAVLDIIQLLEKKPNCLDLFLSALRKSVEGYVDQQHSHFQLIMVLVKKKEEMQVLHCEGTTRAIVRDTCHTRLPCPCMFDCTTVLYFVSTM